MIPRRILQAHDNPGYKSPWRAWCAAHGWEYQFQDLRTTWHEFGMLVPEVSDLARDEMAWRYGGWWLDTDTKPGSVSLDELAATTSAPFLFAWFWEVSEAHRLKRAPRWHDRSSPFRVYASYAFGAEGGHPFLSHWYDTMLARWREERRERRFAKNPVAGVLHTTGPDALGAAIDSYVPKLDFATFQCTPYDLGPYVCHANSGWWLQAAKDRDT